MAERGTERRGIDHGVLLDPARPCPKCPSPLLIGGTHDRPFWVCPACHMAFLSPALMGHAEAVHPVAP